MQGELMKLKNEQLRWELEKRELNDRMKLLEEENV